MSYCSHGSQVDAVPTTATPNRQSRPPTHIATAYSSARMPPHQIVGVPIRSTCRMTVLPAAASQPRVPGLMSVSAATPTGLLRSSHPDGFEA